MLHLLTQRAARACYMYMYAISYNHVLAGAPGPIEILLQNCSSSQQHWKPNETKLQHCGL